MAELGQLILVIIYVFGVVSGATIGYVFFVLRNKKSSKATHSHDNPLDLLNSNESIRLAKENETLKRELQQSANIINRSRNAVWVRDENMRITYCNLAFSEIAEECSEQDDPDGGLELYRGEYKQAKTVYDSGEDQVINRHIVVDGERRLYRVRATPSHQDACLTCYAVDTTELEKANLEIKRHMSALSDLLESSTNAAVIYGPDFRMENYNVAYANLWRLDDIWLDTKPTMSEVLEHLRERRILPEQSNFPAFKEGLMRQFQNLIEPEEEFYFLPDGRTLRMIAIPHALGGVLLSYEDVTDRLALERNYNTLIAVQKETLDNLHEGVAVFGEDGRIKLSNPAFLNMWKLEAKDVEDRPHIGQFLAQTKALHKTDNWDEYAEEFTHKVQGRAIQASELERTNGTMLNWSSVPLPDGATLQTFIDVTDTMLVQRSLKEKNEALQAADRLKTEFLANVSYELRSPLTSIIGFADILRQKIFGEMSDKQAEYVEGIYDSSQHLSELIGNILDLASIEAGYLELDESDFNVAHMIDEVANLFLARMKERSVAFDVVVDSTMQMHGDQKRIKQVLFQLLSNAVKYTPAHGSITVEVVWNDKQELVFSVVDTGVGIAPEMQQRVFDGFFRGGASEGQKSGSGLGLSMVKSMVELHGGRVALTSSPKEGTTVICVFPPKPTAKEAA